MRPILLDERLSLAIELFPTCEIGADIGTDHGLFPCRLLEEGRCQRMILSDISEKALAHAQALVERRGLQAKTALVIANGLDCLTKPVDCVSIMGMGGRTIAEILHAGQARLHGATLVLSAHTDLELVRQAVPGHRLSFDAGASVPCWKPLVCFFTGCAGSAHYSPLEMIVGPCLPHSGDPLLPGYAAWRHRVWAEKLAGLRTAREPDTQEIARVEAILEAYMHMMKEEASC